MTITTDFTGDEVTAEAHARIRAIASHYGTNLQTLGDARAALNPFLDDPIGARDFAGHFLPKLNKLNQGDLHWLNDMGGAVSWYDPSDLSSLFQDVAGVFPVTAPGQGVALMLDKGNGGAGPPLIPNGNFSDGSAGWVDASTLPATAVVLNGALNLVSNGVARARYRSTVPTIIGRLYRFQIEVLEGTVEINCGTTSAGVEYFGFPSAPPGIYTRYVYATSTTMQLQIHKGVEGKCVVDHVVFEELLGAHAVQRTTSARPVLCRLPEGGTRNLARGSASPTIEWRGLPHVSAGVTTTQVGAGVEDGLPYRDFRQQGTAVGNNVTPVYSGLTTLVAAAGDQFTTSFIVRVIAGTPPPAPSGCRAEVACYDASSVLSEQTLSGVAAPTVDTPMLASRTLQNPTTAIARPQAVIRVETGRTVDVTYRIKAVQFERGVEVTPYQANYETFDITEAGKESRFALLHDMVDDTMVAGIAPNITRVVRRNMVVNNVNAGAVVGLLSAGGALPTGLTISGMPTTGIEVLSLASKNGRPNLRLRLTGVPSQGSSVFINTLLSGAAVPAVAGETWTGSVWLQRVGGSNANINTFHYGTYFHDTTTSVSGSLGTELSGSIGVDNRVATTATAISPLVDRIASYIRLGTNGGAIDITLDISAPQTEKAAVPTDPQLVLLDGKIVERRNLLNLTHDMGIWALQQTPDVTADGVLGGEPAFRLTDNTTTQWEAVTMAFPGNLTTPSPYTLSVRVKKETSATSAASARLNITAGGTAAWAGFRLNTVTGVIDSASWVYGGAVSSAADMGTYWQVTVKFTLAPGDMMGSLTLFAAHHSLNFSDGTAVNVGSNTWAAPQLETGSIATNYQRVISELNIEEVVKHTVASASEAGVSNLAGQSVYGNYTLPNPQRLFGAMMTTRALAVKEAAQLLAWLNKKRP